MSERFVSYAQNLEDVMLWRALKNVSEGFYVDVGAAWPEQHSVTAAFYDRGWSGINIEPNPDFHLQICNARKRDINLNILVGDSAESSKEFFIIPGTGLSTADDSIAANHRVAGFRSQTVEVVQLTLTDVFTKYASGKEIHFLKIDVEGAEESVIHSNDWRRFRPWICLVEATRPLSDEESHEAWEPELLSNGYMHVYSDGLNRFYVRSESAFLSKFFGVPPNVFDAYKTFEMLGLEQKIEELESGLGRRLAGIDGAQKQRKKSRFSLWWRKFRNR